ncbi:uncharacterized protein A4U43_C03F25620 [Asparagus officinalis]|uniref:Uncharacterized protein n=1 Tax=Asparagus officinalis TaxID=4686 RepID=A0A5P1FDS2_ASPOF|nr:uncharacterized protein A4U43_C03F25620 [Asparagus officinalis]
MAWVGDRLERVWEVIAQRMQTPISAPVPLNLLKRGMTIEAVGEWSILVGATRVGVLVSPRPPTLEQLDPLTKVTLHTGRKRRHRSMKRCQVKGRRSRFQKRLQLRRVKWRFWERRQLR